MVARGAGGSLLAWSMFVVAAMATAQTAPGMVSETAVPNIEERWIVVAGADRSYRVQVPEAVGEPIAGSEVAAGPPALLLALHGNGGDGARMADLSGLGALAVREGFVVVYPDGLDRTWNYVRGVRGYPDAPDDVAFLTAVVESVEAEFGTDRRRRYVVGYSNGGFMAQRLACATQDVFAGFVSVAAAGFAGMETVCAGAWASSVALVHGTADRNVPWEGLQAAVPNGSVFLAWPVPDTLAFWAGRADCAGPVAREVLPGDAVAGIQDVVLLRLDACRDGRRVALFGVRGGGHAWPAGPGFDATAAAWSFLRELTAP